MNLAIVNDVPAIVTLLRKIIEGHSEHRVIWTANGGEEAIQKACENTPDLILMDLIMPGMNGAEATRRIMKECPCGILIVTVSIDRNADLVFAAMSDGALDATTTPLMGGPNAQEEIDHFLYKIHILERLINPRGSARHKVVEISPDLNKRKDACPLVAIGASTGGPGALAQILKALPADLPAAVVIVQHVDKNFTDDLSQWLDGQCALDVHTARHKDTPERGKVLLVGGDRHLVLQQDQRLVYDDKHPELIYKPSVDLLFESASQYWPDGIIGVLLTGMGKDGANGLLSIRRRGMPTIAQNKETCAVFGMPKAAIALEAAEQILPIDAIADAILQKVGYSYSRQTGNR